MHSELIRLGPIIIHSYGACLALAILLCYFILVKLGRPLGYTSDFISSLLTVLIVSGLIGARIFYVAEHWSHYSQHLSEIVKVWEGGLMFYGGLLCSAASLIVFIRLQKKPIADVLDIIVTALPVSHAVGRIGCFLNGCCYGRTSSCSLAVTYPRGSIPWAEQLQKGVITPDAVCSSPVLPTQLLEAALNVAIFVVLLLLFRRKRKPGEQVAAYMMLYAVARFVLEYSRADERLYFGPFSISQTISIALFTVGLALMIWLRQKEKAGPLESGKGLKARG